MAVSVSTDVAEIIEGTVQNGRWYQIRDPQLREFVRLHVVHACRDVADVSQLHEAERFADEALGGVMPPLELNEVAL